MTDLTITIIGAIAGLLGTALGLGGIITGARSLRLQREQIDVMREGLGKDFALTITDKRGDMASTFVALIEARVKVLSTEVDKRIGPLETKLNELLTMKDFLELLSDQKAIRELADEAKSVKGRIEDADRMHTESITDLQQQINGTRLILRSVAEQIFQSVRQTNDTQPTSNLQERSQM